MNSKLAVLIDDRIVGTLWLDEKKRFCFQYDKTWAAISRIPLSLSLPLRDGPYHDDESHAFFANLLPEQRMREVIARNLGVSLGNDYGLLEKIGGECAGAVSLYPEGAADQKQETAYKELTSTGLKEIIQRLPQKPLLAGEAGIRLSLAGAQNKLPVFLHNEIFHLVYGGAPSNYIIKPPIEGLDGTVENEAFCMALARGIGLEVPLSSIHLLDGLQVFVIKRYDRTIINDETK
ncbi:MAG TPA: HipA N-terminal domain-containing protein, partial [Geobacteraceae bacterium]|nr:HipA N-terminal domain-containing protein [Geobacteraceae bacterium]